MPGISRIRAQSDEPQTKQTPENATNLKCETQNSKKPKNLKKKNKHNWIGSGENVLSLFSLMHYTARHLRIFDLVE